MTNIPFADLYRQYPEIKHEIFAEIEKVFEKCAFTNGFSVKDFESAFAKYCQTKYSIAVNSGTSALHLALASLDIKEGDEVIVPANTFIATAWAVAYQKAVPVFVDCDPLTWEIDPEQVQAKISKRTKAVIGVHLYGQSFDVDAVKRMVSDKGIFLIEDACQAHGATYKGNAAGSLADMGCFSFYPGKNLGTYGEGGAITTNNEKLAERISSLRNHGSTARYYHDEIGYNMRMGGVEAAVLNVKLRYIDKWNDNRKEIAKKYLSGIGNKKIKFQVMPGYTSSVYHLFVVTVECRDEFIAHLNKHGISPGLHYPVPCHLQKAFEYLGYKKGDLPNAEYLAEHCVSLPMFPELTNGEVLHVIEAVNSF
ncbi:MAG: DegT/DnrJ/EryC1/StrS family aminotransferase [Bacteroidales bacterium]